MASDQVVKLAGDLWRELGYDGCRELREALRLQMAQHREEVRQQRRAAGLARPRSRRQPTSAARAAARASAMVGRVSETYLQRTQVVQRYAPHLIEEVTAERMSMWAAYRQAIGIRDAAAVTAVTVDPLTVG
ncbi:MAG: hypothetical protein VKO65_04245 [Cyanobacteriota bacterium]|nr:hypothetical protein [Cyanobacteriota bacterium]